MGEGEGPTHTPPTMMEYVQTHCLRELVQEALNQCYSLESGNPAAILSEFFAQRADIGIIDRLGGEEVLDSRGRPSIRVTCFVNGRASGSSTSPTGACPGKFEAAAVLDGDTDRYEGEGMTKAVNAVNEVLNEAVRGRFLAHIEEIDAALRAADGTKQLATCGGPAVSASSAAISLAAARISNRQPFAFLAESYFQRKAARCTMPRPIFTLMEGMCHGGGKLRQQGVLLVLPRQEEYSEYLRLASQTQRSLLRILKAKFGSTVAFGVGDLGGLVAPEGVEGFEQALSLCEEAAIAAGVAAEDLQFGINCGGPQTLVDQEGLKYSLSPDCSTRLSSDEVADYYVKACSSNKKITLLIDTHHEEDWPGHKKATAALYPQGVITAGDDLFGSQPDRLRRGLMGQQASAVVLKAGAAGTVSDCFTAHKTIAECSVLLRDEAKNIQAQREKLAQEKAAESQKEEAPTPAPKKGRKPPGKESRTATPPAQSQTQETAKPVDTLKLIFASRAGSGPETFDADLAVALSADYVHFGGVMRAECTEKYNRLVDIQRAIRHNKIVR